MTNKEVLLDMLQSIVMSLGASGKLEAATVSVSDGSDSPNSLTE